VNAPIGNATLSAGGAGDMLRRMSQLDGKVAIVTGGASGIGLAVAERFAEEGAHVVVADLEPPAPASSDRITATRCDVTSAEDVERAMGAADALGGVDVLVNNAGIFSRGGYLDVTPDEYDRMFAINVKAVFFVGQAAARRMLARGSGSIINLSSVAGIRGSAGSSLYCASKGAVRLLTYALAEELGPHGIRVNAIHPGLIDTPLARNAGLVGTDEGDERRATIPLRRIGTPDDVAAGAVYLASDQARQVSGISLTIDGGVMRV